MTVVHTYFYIISLKCTLRSPKHRETVTHFQVSNFKALETKYNLKNYFSKCIFF